MLIKRDVYFSAVDTETGEERLFSVKEILSEEEYLEKLYSDEEFQKEFGVKSKVLGAVAPGAWQAKEAAKYAYDEDEYKKKRAGYALKGAFTPGVATAVKKKAEKMAKEGKSKEEIREFLEKSSGGRVAAGVGEVLTGGLGGVTHTVAAASGLYDTVTENRAKPDKKQKNYSDEKESTGAGKLAAAGGLAMAGGVAAAGKNFHTFNKVSQRAGYKNLVDHVKNGTGFIVGREEVAKARKGERMMKAAMKNKKVRALGVAANVGQLAGTGLLIGAGIKKARGNKKD